MTPTQMARRSDALYADGTCGMTRRVLCDMVAQREADLENARAEFDKMDKWHSVELQASMAENAKLRELVRTFYHCTTSGECDECPINGGGPVHLMPDTICDTIHDRMRELGIEVDG